MEQEEKAPDDYAEFYWVLAWVVRGNLHTISTFARITDR